MTPLPLQTTAAALAEHALLLANIADPNRDLPEANGVRHLVGVVMGIIDQMQAEDTFGEPLGTTQRRDALRKLRHVDLHLVEAHVSALVARWPAFDLATYLHQFRLASEYACGPGLNTGHLAESCLTRLTRALHTPQLQRNWLDLITFGIDGAQRTGATPADIVAYLEHMLTRFRNRAADLSARDPYEQTDHTARHTDVASREV
jgi:hypothetical protein